MRHRKSVEITTGPVSYLEWLPTEVSAAHPGPDVLLLHGGGYDNAGLSWPEVGSALGAAGYRVIAPDHPGYGHSPLPAEPCTQRRQLDYLHEFVSVLGLDRYVIGGLSMGGGLSLGHVLQHPDQVLAMMLLGSGGLMHRQLSGPLGLPVQLLEWLTVRTGLMRVAFRWYGRSRRLTRTAIPNLIRNPDVPVEPLLDDLMAATTDASALAFTQWQRDQILPTRIRDDYTARLDSITAPTLVVHGDHDPGVPVAHARKAARLLPEAELLIVAGAAHWVQRDRPDVVIPAMIEFLGRVAPRPAS